MFVGKSKHTVTKDGRVSIPSKMREIMTEKYGTDELYVVLMQGNIICLYPDKEFEKLAERLENPQGVPLNQFMQTERDICSNAENCKIDGSGRILIPPDMKASAKIDQEVMIVGARSRIELWNPEIWTWNQTHRGSDTLRTWPGAQSVA
jgi:MraZ protein